MAKPDDVKRDANNEKSELTIDELNAVTGGDAKPPPPQSNMIKKWSDTSNGIVANIK
jgi:bacteriocin-like protein